MIYARQANARMTRNLERKIPFETSIYVERMFRVDTTGFAVAAKTKRGDSAADYGF
jgi:hypothetical protein